MAILSDIRLTQLAHQIKQPSVAGTFYPADPEQLQQLVTRLLDEAACESDPPKALIAPHAGYIYSGAIAASAYATLQSVRHRIKRVVLLGPAHHMYLQGMAVSHADQFATPLGLVPVDRKLRERVLKLPTVDYVDKAFTNEHSLEVHLPFLQSVLDQFTLLPIIVGDTQTAQITELLQNVWGGSETLIVISSDLSHYHDYATAKSLDTETSHFIESLQVDKLGSDRACGCRPVNGLLQIARDKNMDMEVLDVRNSGDTAGKRDRVVGYGAYALLPGKTIRHSLRQLLLDIAIASIENGFKQDKAYLPDLRHLPAELQPPAAVFVTLMQNGKLRGCIGTTEPGSALGAATALYAYSSAFRDPRFPGLTEAEFDNLDISISVLSEKTELIFGSEQDLLDKLEPGVHGLVISSGHRQATFLPSVWNSISQSRQFLAKLKQKAGMTVEDTIERAWTYTTCSFSRKYRRQLALNLRTD